MKQIVAAALIVLTTAARAEPCKSAWDRSTIGCLPVGAAAPNKPRDTTDYGVKYSDGTPALGCKARTMQIASPDGHSGLTAVYLCR